jgi:hypothetical protein
MVSLSIGLQYLAPLPPGTTTQFLALSAENLMCYLKQKMRAEHVNAFRTSKAFS